jgi:hypothetical protein
MLWQDLAGMPDVKFLLPHKINQDCLESFFCLCTAQRWFQEQPSCCHLRSKVGQIVANKLLSSCPGGNCDANNDSILLSLMAMAAATTSSLEGSLTQNSSRDNSLISSITATGSELRV